MHTLLQNCKITRVKTDGAGAASATPTKCDIIDMQGYESVMFVAMLGDVLTTSAVSLRVAGADTNSSGAMALLTGSAGGTAGASDYDDKLLVLDVVKPNQRYLECQIFHVTANAPFDGILAIQYNPRSAPVTQGSTVIASTTISDPDVA
ncbi:hypothetical protein GJ700_12650 [Duganella sp. FT92W]|uniref:Uncharacterized protein n=1 Tax=Pseudoduganella rivuli TaxID=2666085 RepID=A0A7X2LU12_9BURK|nr:hypothetical protein [Pseudoduganella rivuli]MRV72557.1 hypothetical protein [Pseudoduganella rivuli]